MATSTPLPTVTEPLPIFKLAHKYLVYDPDTVSYLRREHNICGVFIGSLPQAPQQNVFLGLPLELMPEEARLLVEKAVAYVVDDVLSHKKTFLHNGLSLEERKAFQAALRKQGLAAAKSKTQRGDDKRKAALARKAESEGWNDIPEDMLESPRDRHRALHAEKPKPSASEADGDVLFTAPEEPAKRASITKASEPEPFLVTPATSYPPTESMTPSLGNKTSVAEALPSYPLYKHLHDQGYFMSPGLRFGCQFVAYPGDPLRFHSHFLCNGMDWDQEFDLLDLVGGGRLGTGVKKGFLIGGDSEEVSVASGRGEGPSSEVRSFCIEWGGM